MTTKKFTKKSDASAKVFSFLILTFGLFFANLVAVAVL